MAKDFSAACTRCPLVQLLRHALLWTCTSRTSGCFLLVSLARDWEFISTSFKRYVNWDTHLQLRYQKRERAHLYPLLLPTPAVLMESRYTATWIQSLR